MWPLRLDSGRYRLEPAIWRAPSSHCRLAAQAVALVYNWWNPYLRMVEPRKHLEAITARPLLMSAVARRSEHAHQRITPLHVFAQQAIARLQAVSAKLKAFRQTDAEQMSGASARQFTCRYIRDLLLAVNRLRCPSCPISDRPSWPSTTDFRLIGQDHLAYATQKALIAAYENTILNACADVETALGQVRNSEREEALLRDEVAAGRKAFQTGALQSGRRRRPVDCAENPSSESCPDTSSPRS